MRPGTHILDLTRTPALTGTVTSIYPLIYRADDGRLIDASTLEMRRQGTTVVLMHKSEDRQ